jgi:outer membrane protein OmpA-like peptidoglycan-associated protein
MNINVFLGALSFVIWSIFSTGLYVKYIKVFDPAPQKEAAMVTVKEGINTPFSAKDNEPKAVVEAPKPVTLSKSFTFHKNTAKLMYPGAIKQFTDSIQAILSGREVSVSITGHTCDLGSESYNFNLGLLRANYAIDALNESSINWPQMISKSKGESNPILPNTSEINRIKNRRVTILITTKP